MKMDENLLNKILIVPSLKQAKGKLLRFLLATYAVPDLIIYISVEEFLFVTIFEFGPN